MLRPRIGRGSRGSWRRSAWRIRATGRSGSRSTHPEPTPSSSRSRRRSCWFGPTHRRWRMRTSRSSIGVPARPRRPPRMRELSAILAIAHRDFIKLIRDRPRIVADLAFPLIFIGILGSSLQAGYGSRSDINLLTFVFTGVLAQTVWQSAALGVISLIADREQDYSQEMFVSPVSRYAIIAGKILGESLVTLPQAAAILAFGAILGVPLNIPVLI